MVLQRFLLCFKYLFVAVANALKKAACFVSRKKKIADDSDPTAVIVLDENKSTYSRVPHQASADPCHNNVSNFVPSPPQQLPANDVEMVDWNNWNTQDFDGKTEDNLQPDEHAQEEKPDINFFEDMEPDVRVTKIFVKKKTRNVSASNRLAVDQDLDFAAKDELDEWEDEDANGGGWGDEVDLDVDEAKILREAQERRKMERQERAKQHRLDKSLNKTQKLAQRVT